MSKEDHEPDCTDGAPTLQEGEKEEDEEEEEVEEEKEKNGASDEESKAVREGGVGGGEDVSSLSSESPEASFNR